MARPSLTAVPAQRSSLLQLQVRRRLVIVLLLVAAGAGLLSAFAWLTHSEATFPGIPARDEVAVSLATVVVHDLVAGRDSGVPAAEGVATTFSAAGQDTFAGAEVTFAGTTQVRIGDPTKATMVVQRSTFHVTVPGAENPTVYAVSVPMVQSPRGWVLASAPSISPVQLATPVKVPDYAALYPVAGTGASELTSLPYGAAAISQIQKWAQVFASEGKASQGLFAITGARDSTFKFDGLGGWGVERVDVKSFLLSPNPEADVDQFGQQRLVVRVALVLTPGGANGPTLNAEYDVLLQPGANPGQPPVTAWGPAAAGPTFALENYQNNTNG